MDNKSERRKYHFIYKTTCLATARWYLGMHSTNDLQDGYLGSGTHLQRSIKKYGKESHKIEIVEMLPTRAELRLREQEILTEQFIADPLCMNIRFSCSAGNDPGFWAKKDREQTSAKISARSKRMWEERKADPIALAEHCAKLNTPTNVARRAEAVRAKKHKRSEEQLQRLRAGQSKYYSTVDKEVLAARGRKVAETRAKIWIIEDRDWNRQQIKDVVKFSLANGIKGTALYKTETRQNFANGFRIVGREHANT